MGGLSAGLWAEPGRNEVSLSAVLDRLTATIVQVPDPSAATFTTLDLKQTADAPDAALKLIGQTRRGAELAVEVQWPLERGDIRIQYVDKIPSGEKNGSYDPKTGIVCITRGLPLAK